MGVLRSVAHRRVESRLPVRLPCSGRSHHRRCVHQHAFVYVLGLGARHGVGMVVLCGAVSSEGSYWVRDSVRVLYLLTYLLTFTGDQESKDPACRQVWGTEKSAERFLSVRPGMMPGGGAERPRVHSTVVLLYRFTLTLGWRGRRPAASKGPPMTQPGDRAMQ